MANETSIITIGLAQIKVGAAAPNGTMPGELTKIGKVYKDTCKIAQDASDVTEHFEEGKAAPEVRKKAKKIPSVTFSLMDATPEVLSKYIGGEVDPSSGAWGYSGDEVTTNVSMLIETEQGLNFEIPNADVEAVINADLSTSGIFLVDFTVTPCAVKSGKAIRAVKKAS